MSDSTIDRPNDGPKVDDLQVQLAVDVVLFTIGDDQLNVVLVERGVPPFMGSWALPGGFVLPEETLERAALRELEEETGVKDQPGHLEQLETYGNPDRDPRSRVVTIAYWAIMAGLDHLRGGGDAKRAELVSVAKIEDREVKLAFDHEKIVYDAVKRVQSKLEYTTLATKFCPPEFTLSQLRNVYETLWKTDLDEGNFQRKIRSSPDFVVGLQSRRGSGELGGRPARLFSAGRADYLDKPIASPLFSLISHRTGDEPEIGLDSRLESGPLRPLEDEEPSKEDEEES